jgi:hypothetical protein
MSEKDRQIQVVERFEPDENGEHLVQSAEGSAKKCRKETVILMDAEYVENGRRYRVVMNDLGTLYRSDCGPLDSRPEIRKPASYVAQVGLLRNSLIQGIKIAEDLMKFFESELPAPRPLHVTDISRLYMNSFTEKAREALKPQVASSLLQVVVPADHTGSRVPTEEDKEFVARASSYVDCRRIVLYCQYVSVLVRDQATRDAKIKLVIDLVNALAEEGFVHGCLLPLSTMQFTDSFIVRKDFAQMAQLAAADLQPAAETVLSYIFVHPGVVDSLKDFEPTFGKVFMKEGEIPPLLTEEDEAAIRRTIESVKGGNFPFRISISANPPLACDSCGSTYSIWDTTTEAGRTRLCEDRQACTERLRLASMEAAADIGPED